MHYRTVCTSENRLGQTVQIGQQALGHLELFSDYVWGPKPNKIPVYNTLAGVSSSARGLNIGLNFH